MNENGIQITETRVMRMIKKMIKIIKTVGMEDFAENSNRDFHENLAAP